MTCSPKPRSPDAGKRLAIPTHGKTETPRLLPVSSFLPMGGQRGSCRNSIPKTGHRLWPAISAWLPETAACASPELASFSGPGASHRARPPLLGTDAASTR